MVKLIVIVLFFFYVLLFRGKLVIRMNPILNNVASQPEGLPREV